MKICVPDVNECEDDDNVCNQICNNTEGGFDCLCHIGFELGNDGTTCSGL